jgi:hypothetical protein
VAYRLNDKAKEIIRARLKEMDETQSAPDNDEK